MTPNKLITTYLNEMSANGIKDTTLNKIRPTLKQMDEFLSGDIQGATKEDITNFILSWNTEDKIAKDGRRIHNIKESTKVTRKAIIKKFFNWLGREELVKDIKTRMPKNHLTQDDILTPEDINLLLENTNSHFYKALIAILYESGARIGEIQALRVKDFKESSKGMIVEIPTLKTDFPNRKMLLLFAAQYVRNYFTYANKDKDDIVFNRGKSPISEMLRKIGKKAGINKKVNPHRFRHASATVMVQQGFNESIIRRKLGWSPTSGMISRYQHLADSDIMNAQLSVHGEKIERPVIKDMDIAEPISVADTNAIIQKQAAEMEEIKNEMERQEKIKTSLQEMNKNRQDEFNQQAAELAEMKERMENLDSLVNQRIAEILEEHFTKTRASGGCINE